MMRWDITGTVLGVVALLGVILISTHDLDTRTVREIAQGEIKELNVSKVVASYTQAMTRGPPGVFPSPFTQSVVFANGLVNATDLSSVTQEQALVSFFNTTVDQWTGEGISHQGDWWLRTSGGKLLVFDRHGHLGVGKVPVDALDVAGAASIEVLLSVGGPITAQGTGTFGERLTVVTGGLDVGGDGGATITGNVSIINGDLRLGELSLRNLSLQVEFMQNGLQVLYGGEFRQDERFLALNASVQYIGTLLRAVNASVYGALDLIALSNSRVISVDVDAQGRDQQLGVRIDTLNTTDAVQAQALSLLQTDLEALRVNASINFTILIQLNAITNERLARLIDNQTEFQSTQQRFNDSLLSLWQLVAQMNERETLDLANVTALWQAMLKLQTNVSSLDARQTLCEQDVQVLESNVSSLASQLLQLNISFNASLFQQTVHHLALMNVMGLLGSDVQVIQSQIFALNLTDVALSDRIDRVNITAQGLIDTVALLNAHVQTTFNTLTLTDQLVQANVSTLSSSLAALTIAHALTLDRVVILEVNVSGILVQLPRLATLNTSLITLTNAQGVTTANLQTVSNTLSALDAAYLLTVGQVIVLQSNVSVLSLHLAAVNASDQAQALRITALEQGFTTLTNVLAITNADVLTLSDTLTATTAAHLITADLVTIIQGNITTLSNGLTSVNASLQALWTLRASDVLRIDSLNQTSMTLINTLGLANANIQTVTNAQATTATQVTVLQTQVAILQGNVSSLSAVVNPTLGANVADNALVTRLQAITSNADALETIVFRNSAGTAFDTAAWRIQRVVDGDSATAFPFIEFTQTHVGIGRRARYSTTASTLTASGSAVVVTGTFTVSGAATLSSTLAVTGATTFTASARSVTVLGASGLGDVTGVTATWLAYDTANDRGYIYASISGTMYKNLYLSDPSVSTTIGGPAIMSSTLTVAGTATLSGLLNLNAEVALAAPLGSAITVQRLRRLSGNSDMLETYLLRNVVNGDWQNAAWRIHRNVDDDGSPFPFAEFGPGYLGLGIASRFSTTAPAVKVMAGGAFYATTGTFSGNVAVTGHITSASMVVGTGNIGLAGAKGAYLGYDTISDRGVLYASHTGTANKNLMIQEYGFTTLFGGPINVAGAATLSSTLSVSGSLSAGGALVSGNSHSFTAVSGKPYFMRMDGALSTLDAVTSGSIIGLGFYPTISNPTGATSTYVTIAEFSPVTTLNANAHQHTTLYTYPNINVQTFTLAAFYGLYIPSGAFTLGSGGAVTDAYGARIENPGAGTNRVAVWAGSLVVGGGLSSAAQAAANSAIFNGPTICTSTFTGTTGTFSSNVDATGFVASASMVVGTGSGGFGGKKGTWLGYDTVNDRGILLATHSGTANKNLMIQEHGLTTLFGGPVFVVGATTLASTVGVGLAMTLSSTLSVAGDTTLSGFVNCYRALSLGATMGAYTLMAQSQTSSIGNIDLLETYFLRRAAGSDWVSAAWRMQRNVDYNTGIPFPFIEFGSGGLGLGAQPRYGTAGPTVQVSATTTTFTSQALFVKSGLNVVVSDSGSTGDSGTNALFTVEGNSVTPIIKLTKSGVASAYITTSASGLVFNTDTANAILFRLGAPGGATAPETQGTLYLAIYNTYILVKYPMQFDDTPYISTNVAGTHRIVDAGRSTTSLAGQSLFTGARNILTGVFREWERSSLANLNGWTGFNSADSSSGVNQPTRFDQFFQVWVQWLNNAGNNAYLQYTMVNPALQAGLYWVEYTFYMDSNAPTAQYADLTSSCAGPVRLRSIFYSGTNNGLTRFRDPFQTFTGCNYGFRITTNGNQYVRINELVFTLLQ